jgi:D-glycero-D-manno-heptose 1,7-bisphosphate phosphatase
MKKAVFIDKDGTLIKDIAYNVNPDKIELEPYAEEALQLLSEQDYSFIIISNQAGIARGYFKESDLQGVIDKVKSLLAPAGVILDGFFYCPHHPEGAVPEYAINCTCRKPEPGMILQAADIFDIDLSKSWMIGDILNDIEAGNRAGCRSLLINNGHETMWELNEYRLPLYAASNLMDAAEYIINNQ